MSLIEVIHLKKDFEVIEQQQGFIKVLKSFFRQQKKTVHAVDDLSFNVEKGEVVGFIGENGAGKSTTIKIMTGILFPTSGEVLVGGLRPYENRLRNALEIGVIFGQRSRLLWDLPMQDSFALYKEIYHIDHVIYKKNIDRFTKLLNMGDYIKTPVRQLSLGQRMKVEIALALLHEPKILFLDEPTIGLDVLAKNNIREFIRESNEESGTTILLTSHDMKDLDHVCSRIVMISKGKLVYDGKTDNFKRTYGTSTLIRATLANEAKISHPLLSVTENGLTKDIVFDKSVIPLAEVVAYLYSQCELVDMTVREPDIEEIVRNIYSAASET